MAARDSKTSKHNVVIIGGSYAGLHVAHYLLKNVFSSLEPVTNKNYKITMLTNSSKFFQKVPAPRGLINPQRQSSDQLFIDIAPGFKQYGDAYELVLGFARNVNHTARLITYEGTEGNASGSLSYDSLVIASGTTFEQPLWSATFGWEKLEAEFAEVHKKLETAKTILVAGGGPVGTEISGELGARFKKSGDRDITLLSGTTRLLSNIQNTAFGADAERRLTKLGVKVVHNVRVESQKENADGTTTVKLTNGETKTVDLFIASTGDKNKGNSTFVPNDWLTDDRSVKTVPSTLRLDVPGVNDVYVFGSVGSHSDGAIPDILFGYKAVCESFRFDQLAAIGSKSILPSIGFRSIPC